MGKKELFNKDEKDDLIEESNAFWVVESRDGNLRCSCGRPLVKITDTVWRCSFGWPVFRLDQGEVMVDKFGRLMMKNKPH